MAASNSDEDDENKRCRIITEVAVEQAMEACGTEEAVKDQLQRIVGLDGEPDPDCDAALAEGLNEETLQNMRGTRQWVMCEAWRLVQEEDKTLSAAVANAWAQANAKGKELDIEV